MHGLSQEKYAKLIAVDETTIAKWEHGEHAPSKKLIGKLSIFLNKNRLVIVHGGDPS